jgi:hypothetical protein
MYVCMYAPFNCTWPFLTFTTQTNCAQFSRHPIFEGVASKDPGGLIFLALFLPHRTRSAHLLCTLSTTPLPAAPLAIAARGAEQPHLLLFTIHGNTVTSVRLSHVYHSSTDTMCCTGNGITGQINESRKTFRIYHNKQLVLLPAVLTGVWSPLLPSSGKN